MQWWISRKIHKGQYNKIEGKTEEVSGEKDRMAPVWTEDMKICLIRVVLPLFLLLCECVVPHNNDDSLTNQVTETII